MVQLGFRKPVNKVTQGGGIGPEYLKVGANATAAKMLPGIVVIRDTNDYSVMEADGNGQEVGYLGYDEAAAVFKPDDIDVAYAVGDEVPVHSGAGRRQLARLATGQSVVKGDPLKIVADGYLSAATVGTDDVAADAAETVDATSASKKIWVYTRK